MKNSNLLTRIQLTKTVFNGKKPLHIPFSILKLTMIKSELQGKKGNQITQHI